MPLAYEESAFELLDVTLAREDDRPRVPDHTEAKSLPIRLLLRNKYFETYLFGLLTTLPGHLSRSDLTKGLKGKIDT